MKSFPNSLIEGESIRKTRLHMLYLTEYLYKAQWIRKNNLSNNNNTYLNGAIEGVNEISLYNAIRKRELYFLFKKLFSTENSILLVLYRSIVLHITHLVLLVISRLTCHLLFKAFNSCKH
jgi:hypothetical protein